MADKVPSVFGAATVFAPTGEAVRVSDLWLDRTAVIALIRHFG